MYPKNQDKWRGTPGDSQKEMTPKELSSFMRNIGPVFEDEAERIEELILEGREQPRDNHDILPQ